MRAEPDSVYGALRGRLLSAEEVLWRRERDADLHVWIQFWAIGLGLLGPASSEARDAVNRWTGWTGLADGVLNGPAREAALRTIGTSQVEQYHELCLIALSQPLLEALATAYLASRREPAGYRPGHRVPLRWPEMLRKLEAEASTPARLLEAARLVEATLGTGRDRLIAHVPPGSLGAGVLRDAEGIKQWGGRIFIENGPATEQALAILNELNAQLPLDGRSQESNIYELGSDLLVKAGRMPVAWGVRLQSVAVAVGFQLDFIAGATSLIELLEAVAEPDHAIGMGAGDQ